MILSKRSQDFLDNLRVYLVSSGKNETEIDEIVFELEDHLTEAEKKGKNIDDIIGSSPKEYMKQIAKELSIDYLGWSKYIPIFLIGFFAFIVLGDVLSGGIKYAWIEIIGYPVTALVLLFITLGVFRFLATHQMSKKLEMLSLLLLSFLYISLFIGLMFLKDFIGTTVVEFALAGNITSGILSSLVLIALAFWSKTLVPIVIPLALYLPEQIINTTTNWGLETKLITSSLMTFIVLMIYVIFGLKADRRK